MLDLSGFQTAEADLLISQVNVVLDIELEKVVEDPDQPRQEFDDESLNALADDLRIRGVQTPIAVRPLENGVYKIIHGARRYRASKIAGLPTIPLIVQSNEVMFDDYSQIAENTKRAGLHPMDIARFIQKRKESGESNKEIAEKLGERPEYIVYHLALLEAPPQVLTAFNEGRIRGAFSVWSMIKLAEKNPQAVEKLLDHPDRITQKMIRDAGSEPEPAAGTAHAETQYGSDGTGSDDGSTETDDESAGEQGEESGANTQGDEDVDARSGSLDSVVKSMPQASKAVQTENQTSRAPENTSNAQRTDRLQRPVVYGVFEDRPVEVLVFRKPTDHGLVWIKWEDASGSPEEVLADKVYLSRIEGV